MERTKERKNGGKRRKSRSCSKKVKRDHSTEDNGRKSNSVKKQKKSFYEVNAFYERRREKSRKQRKLRESSKKYKEKLRKLDVRIKRQETAASDAECWAKFFSFHNINEERRYRKRRRTEYDHLQGRSSCDYSLLPDVVVMELFRYLNVYDRCRLRVVCQKFYEVSKSASLWRKVLIKNVTPARMIRVLPMLPPTVNLLRLRCRRQFCPLWLPEIVMKLNERCPSLKTFILDNALLVRHLYSDCSNRPLIFNMYENLSIKLFQNAKSVLRKEVKQIYDTEYSEKRDDKTVVLPELEVLSLRKTMFSTFYFFSQFGESYLPKLKVLDLTYAVRTCAMHLNRISTLNMLRELYLAGSEVNDESVESVLKDAVNLKVLDLEHTSVGNEAIVVIKKLGLSLEKLFLANTSVEDFAITFEEESIFQEMQTLCLRSTQVTPSAVEKILNTCRSLEEINVSLSPAAAMPLRNLSDRLRQKVVIDADADFKPYCDHFKKSHHFPRSYS